MSNFIFENSMIDVVFPLDWHQSMKDEKAVSSFTSTFLPSNNLNFVSNTIAEAARSWPHPTWNECMLSGKARLASSRPGIDRKATWIGFKALLQASSFIVFRQEAPRLALCQSCSDQILTLSVPRIWEAEVVLSDTQMAFADLLRLISRD